MKDVYDAMLAQCARLQDRFAILDVKSASAAVATEGNNFRNNNVGADNLKYGACYYPQLQTTLGYAYDLSKVKIKTDNRTKSTAASKAIYNNKDLSKVIDGTVAAVAADAVITIDHLDAAGHVVSVAGYSFTLVGASANAIATKLGADITASTDVNTLVDATVATNKVTITAKTAGSAGNQIALGYNPLGNAGKVTLSSNYLVGGYDSIDMPLYNTIVSALDNYNASLYPSGAMAGVYARVDLERGVWKAPANVGLRRVEKPLTAVSDEEQAGLNVDAGSGKSINVIRYFQGKGNLVWGARTLAGNDNEWRYVPVRRLYIMVEESVKKATEFVVFEPNDANTWNRVKTMVGNFLTRLWREGALAGAKPEDAFFVKVGLGQTMTADDILNGIMNVEIGMAAVRPAEFIILKFSHKLAVS
ncbi:MAG: phage tail sheath subtilisin-like domain-containing protein [Bacteroidetes bacterium]|nr:phage tail sheath subtilisin-like domain-containing protein [Bacteroidota bacterium]